MMGRVRIGLFSSEVDATLCDGVCSDEILVQQTKRRAAGLFDEAGQTSCGKRWKTSSGVEAGRAGGLRLRNRMAAADWRKARYGVGCRLRPRHVLKLAPNDLPTSQQLLARKAYRQDAVPARRPPAVLRGAIRAPGKLPGDRGTYLRRPPTAILMPRPRAGASGPRRRQARKLTQRVSCAHRSATQ